MRFNKRAKEDRRRQATINAIDLRTLDRHRDAAVTSLIPALGFRFSCPVLRHRHARIPRGLLNALLSRPFQYVGTCPVRQSKWPLIEAL